VPRATHTSENLNTNNNMPWIRSDSVVLELQVFWMQRVKTAPTPDCNKNTTHQFMCSADDQRLRGSMLTSQKSKSAAGRSRRSTLTDGCRPWLHRQRCCKWVGGAIALLCTTITNYLRSSLYWQCNRMKWLYVSWIIATKLRWVVT